MLGHRLTTAVGAFKLDKLYFVHSLSDTFSAPTAFRWFICTFSSAAVWVLLEHWHT